MYREIFQNKGEHQNYKGNIGSTNDENMSQPRIFEYCFHIIRNQCSISYTNASEESCNIPRKAAKENILNIFINGQ